MDPLILLSLFTTLGSLLGAILAVLNIREKLRAPRPHALEAALRDVAQAIRENPQ